MTTPQYKTVDSSIARANGYKPVTDDYDVEKEYELLEKALASLTGIKYVLVSDTAGETISIWRKKGEVDTIK